MFNRQGKVDRFSTNPDNEFKMIRTSSPRIKRLIVSTRGLAVNQDQDFEKLVSQIVEDLNDQRVAFLGRIGRTLNSIDPKKENF